MQGPGVRASSWLVVRCLQHLPRAAGSEFDEARVNGGSSCDSLKVGKSIHHFLKSRKMFPCEFRFCPARGASRAGVRASSWVVVRCLQHLRRAAGSEFSSPLQNSLTSFKKSKMFPREFGSAGRGARSRGKGKLLNGGPVSAAHSAGSRQRFVVRRRTH